MKYANSWLRYVIAAGCVVALNAMVYSADTDDLIFIHHSCGNNWLINSLNTALVNKEYIDERNDSYYGTDIAPSSGRPDSLPVPGDNTDLNHWLRWFNDYLTPLKTLGCSTGVNRIIMFKSCYPNSDIASAGTEPGDPFTSTKSTANYKAVFRHPSGSGSQYTFNSYFYKALDDIFAENPDILFIYVTAPPLVPSSTTAENAARARSFNNWVKTTWLQSYNTAHPGLNNVAVFDWFDILAVPDGDVNANTERSVYYTSSADSHPNSTANAMSTEVFATNSSNFIDDAWNAFVGGAPDTVSPLAPVNLIAQ